MAKITTGSSFGLNARQATAARLMAEGKKLDTNFVQACGFDIRKEDNPAEVQVHQGAEGHQPVDEAPRLCGVLQGNRPGNCHAQLWKGAGAD